MKIRRDEKLDVAYIQLRSGKNGQGSRIPRVTKTVEIKRGILIDLDRNGEVIGIEILSIRKLAPALKAFTQKPRSGFKKAA